MSFAHSPFSETAAITIEGVTEPKILRYFETFNTGDFTATAALFGQAGTLQPPFESPISGAEAIASYLHREAQDMALFPKKGMVEHGQDGQREILINGHVQTSWCQVEVGWLFVLDPQANLRFARIKLIASPQELLTLQQSAQNGDQ